MYGAGVYERGGGKKQELRSCRLIDKGLGLDETSQETGVKRQEETYALSSGSKD